MKNSTTPVLLGSANPAIAMICAAPKRDAPAALQLPENFATWPLKNLIRVPVVLLQFFMVR